jgi:hypothetical protein
MLKITDTNYELWEYMPLRYIQTLSSGRTAPLLASGICKQNQNKGEIVIKLADATMSADAMCREIIAAWIAKEIDINVAEPILAMIDNISLLAFQQTEVYHRVAQAKGQNFASKWAGDGYSEFVVGFTLKGNLFVKALHIFIFDVFIINADRRFEKQNLKTYQDDIVIFDHESAFGFVFDIFPNASPWLLKPNDKEQWIYKHLFYSEIKKSQQDYELAVEIDNFVNRFQKLDNHFWEKVKWTIPATWQEKHNQIEKIETYLTKIINNSDKFAQEIKELFL